MQPASPSRTAIRVALRRAAHQIYDAPPLILQDPFAVPLLGPAFAEDLRKTSTKLHKPFSSALRAFLVARSRYAEDQLAKLLETCGSHPAQYVLLGAGLDTFALRNPHPNLRVFEVDHPATQQAKRDLLRTAHLPTPACLTWIPLDFEHQNLSGQLSAAGFDPSLPTLFAWLGVIPYLTLDAFRSTLDLITRSAAGSGLVLDYTQPRYALPHFEQLAHDSLAARVLLSDEPFQLFFTPSQIAAELHCFRLLQDLGSPEINALYFADRSDLLATRGTATRLLCAWV